MYSSLLLIFLVIIEREKCCVGTLHKASPAQVMRYAVIYFILSETKNLSHWGNKAISGITTFRARVTNPDMFLLLIDRKSTFKMASVNKTVVLIAF